MSRAGAVEINCHVPITLRIVGVPTDDQLAAVGRALTRAVAAQLAEAERVLTHRYGWRRGGPAQVLGGQWSSAEAAGGSGGARFVLASLPDPSRPHADLLDSAIA